MITEILKQLARIAIVLAIMAGTYFVASTIADAAKPKKCVSVQKWKGKDKHLFQRIVAHDSNLFQTSPLPPATVTLPIIEVPSPRLGYQWEVGETISLNFNMQLFSLPNPPVDPPFMDNYLLLNDNVIADNRYTFYPVGISAGRNILTTISLPQSISVTPNDKLSLKTTVSVINTNIVSGFSFIRRELFLQVTQRKYRQ